MEEHLLARLVSTWQRATSHPSPCSNLAPEGSLSVLSLLLPNSSAEKPQPAVPLPFSVGEDLGILTSFLTKKPKRCVFSDDLKEMRWNFIPSITQPVRAFLAPPSPRHSLHPRKIALSSSLNPLA